MDLSIELMKELPVFNAIVNVALLWLAWSIFKEVRKTNGRLLKLETWQESHQKSDDERHIEIREAIRDIR